MKKSGNIPVGQPIRKNLTRRFVGILVCGAGIAIMCSAIFGYYHASRIRQDGAGAAMERVAESLSDQIDISLDAAVQSLALVAASPEIRTAVAEQNKRYEGLSSTAVNELVLQEGALWKSGKQPQAGLSSMHSNPPGRVLAAFASRYPGFRILKAVDRIGEAAAAFGELDSPYCGQEDWWRESTEAGHDKSIIFGPSYVENPPSTIVRICVPIVSAESVPLGKLYAEYGLDDIVSPSEGYQEEIVAFVLSGQEGRRLHILSPSGLASRSADFGEKDGNVEPRKRGRAVIALNQSEISAIAGFAPVKHSLGSPSVTYSGDDWSVLSALPESVVMAPMNSLFFQALAFSAAVLILLSLGGLMFAQRVLRPIRVLQEGVQEIGQGNLEHRIDVRSGDEIEMLAFEFNRMADRMQRTQEQLQRHSKELEQKVNQLRRLQAQLMQSERMAATGELAAQIAHEINNPLGIIKNYVGIAKLLMAEQDPNRENMKIVDQEINRIAGIVRRLLKFAKPGSEDIQPVQINQVLEELLALLRGQLFRRKIEISSELAENLPEVMVSTDQIRQVFLNLIKNAEDAMPEGGKLTVRTRYRKGRVEIDVQDNGIGIPPADIKNIFEPFFTTKGVKGTGLGLSVSYGIIKNYNGEISVDSEVGKGTTFTIQLPVVSDKVFQVIQSS